MNRLPSLLAIATLGLVLCGCSTFDWKKTGELWLASLCDSSSHCTNDSDGDPYTLR